MSSTALDNLERTEARHMLQDTLKLVQAVLADLEPGSRLVVSRFSFLEELARIAGPVVSLAVRYEQLLKDEDDLALH